MSAEWERLEARLMVTDQCWLWLGSRNTKGYGEMSVNGKSVMVHRLSYQIHRGPIPQGMVIDHLCHDPEVCVGGVCIHRACVNPAHLQLTTNAQNLSRQSPKAKTACLRGHPYDEENTGRNGNGTRYCKACRREARARRRGRYAAASEAAKVREWAKAAGLVDAERGPLAQSVIEAYEAAQRKAA